MCRSVGAKWRCRARTRHTSAMSALSGLGWLQFERLCALVLEARGGSIPESRVGGRRRPAPRVRLGRAGGVRGPHAQAAGDRPLPVAVRRKPRSGAAFEGFRAGAGAARGGRRLARDVRQSRSRAAQDPEVQYDLGMLHDGVEHVVIGEAELLGGDRPPAGAAARAAVGALARRHARASRRDALERSTLDLDAALELARGLRADRGLRAGARRRCASTHFLVLTGPPEMGKTAIARMLGLALLTRRLGGARVHAARRRSTSASTRQRPQLFIADDAFGSTEYRPDAAERWARDLDRILRATDEQPLARLDVAAGAAAAPACAGSTASAAASASRSRPRCRSTPPRSASTEKTLILFRHARAAELDRARSGELVLRARRRDRRAPALHARADPPLRRRPAARARTRRDVRGRRRRAERADARRWRPPTRRSSPSTASCCWRCSTRRPARSPSATSRPRCAGTRRSGLLAGAGRPRRPPRRPLPAGDCDEGRLGPSELARPRDRRARRATTSARRRFLRALRRRRRGAGAVQRRRRRTASACGRCCASDADWDALGDGLHHAVRRPRRGRGDAAARRARRRRSTASRPSALSALVLERLGSAGAAAWSASTRSAAWAAVGGASSTAARSRPRWR